MSATTFTLVGVVNKFITVLLNVLVWDKHSTPIGILAVCLCLLAGSFYQQAPRRDESKADSTLSVEMHAREEEASSLLSEDNGKRNAGTK